MVQDNGLLRLYGPFHSQTEFYGLQTLQPTNPWFLVGLDTVDEVVELLSKSTAALFSDSQRDGVYVVWTAVVHIAQLIGTGGTPSARSKLPCNSMTYCSEA
jgi:hypothetical protein